MITILEVTIVYNSKPLDHGPVETVQAGVTGRFLYAWELGGALGHIGTFEPVAEALRQSGHDVTFAVRETRACPLLLGERFAWLQAPRFDGKPATAAPATYSDILAGVGYSSPDVLMGLVAAWRTLFQLARPHLVLADHAPTAILAARTLGIPVMLFGSGFSLPPSRSPFPAMRPWEQPDAQAIALREAAVLDTVNRVLGQLAVAPLARLCDLFDLAENAMVALPELDHYEQRGAARYWGVLTRRQGAMPAPVAWPAVAGARIFAYIRQERPEGAAILEAIRESGCPSIVYCPDWVSTAPQPPSMHIVTQLVDMNQVTSEADLGIANGTSTAAAFLMAGKPVLSVASHLEQYLFGLRIAQLGAGLVVRSDDHLAAIASALGQLLSNTAFTRQARALAARYAAFDHDAVVRAICARATSLAAT